MAPLELTIVVLLVAWQAAVAFLLILLYRQVTLLSVLTGLTPGRPQASDHPLVAGETLPLEVTERVAGLHDDQVTYLVWITSSCSSCTRFVHGLRDTWLKRPFPDRLVMLVTGSDTAARRLADSLPTGVAALFDPDATAVAERMGLASSPFAIETESGVVTGWTSIHDVEDLWRLRQARESSNAHEIALQANRVI